MSRKRVSKNSKRRAIHKKHGGNLVNHLGNALFELGSVYQEVKRKGPSQATELDFKQLHSIGDKILANPLASDSWKQAAADTQRLAVSHLLSMRR